jgi:membrane peptidoglycan carboxypeptidase
MLKGILVFLLVIWMMGWLLRWVLPFLMLRWMRKFQDQIRQAPRQQHSQTTVNEQSSASKNRPSSRSSQGEYVDYEEIK